MPYIKPEHRKAFDPHIEELAAALPSDEFAGPLNYIVSRLAAGLLSKQTSYARLNEIVGALECAKLELYRRAAAPYEDGKIDANGDVYGGG